MTKDAYSKNMKDREADHEANLRAEKEIKAKREILKVRKEKVSSNVNLPTWTPKEDLEKKIPKALERPCLTDRGKAEGGTTERL